MRYIHLIDDSPSVHKIDGRQLRALGFTVIDHLSAEAFLQYIDANQGALRTIAAIITDKNMEEMDGAQLTSYVRAEESLLDPPLVDPLVIIGSSADDSNVKGPSGLNAKEEFMDSGVNEFYVKPISPAVWKEIATKYGLHELAAKGPDGTDALFPLYRGESDRYRVKELEEKETLEGAESKQIEIGKIRDNPSAEQTYNSELTTVRLVEQKELLNSQSMVDSGNVSDAASEKKGANKCWPSSKCLTISKCIPSRLVSNISYLGVGLIRCFNYVNPFGGNAVSVGVEKRR